MNNYFKSLFKEQPEERFFSLKLTKAVLLSFGFMFVITFTISLFDAVTLKFKPTSEGVNYLVFELFKAPVAVAGFALPLLGLIGLNHRSEQTKKQIEEARVQNDFANYYKHKEEFLKYVETIKTDKCLVTANMMRSHNTLFPKSRRRDFNVSQKQIQRVDRFINSFVKSVPLLFDQDKHESALSNLNKVKGMVTEGFNFSYSSAVEVHTKLGDNDPWRDGTSLPLHEFIYQFVDMVRHVHILFKFDPDYRCSARMFALFQTEWLEVEEIDFDKPEGSEVQVYKQLCYEIETTKPTDVNLN